MKATNETTTAAPTPQTKPGPMPVREIRRAMEALHWAFDNQMTNWADKLLDKCKEEERAHRGFLPDFQGCHTPDTISVNDAARLFAVKRVAEYLLVPKYPSGKEYLHCCRSIFIAAGIADEFSTEIRKAWAEFDLEALAGLNYTDYVKVRRSEELS